MGIYDREYYRDDGGGWWAGMAGRQATVGLMIATGVVGLLQLLVTPQPGGQPGSDPLTLWGEFDRAEILDGQVWRFVTPTFLTDLRANSPLWRVVVSLLVLYFVGTAAEAVYGTREFLAFYLAAGVTVYLGKFLAGICGIDPARTAVGSEGAVMAALVLYACHHPAERVWLFFVIPVPVWVFIALAVGWDLLGLTQGAYPFYIAGGLFGLAYFRLQVRLTDLWDRAARPRAGRRRATPRLSVYRGSVEPGEEPVPAAAVRPPRTAGAGGKGVDEHLEAKLDEVLEKVSRFGRDSLTPEETSILLRASEIYKRRRGP